MNEFFPSGIVITSDETAQTYKEIFESLETTIEYLMADGATGITKAKMEVWEPKDDAVKVLDDGSEVDKQRGMCYPHIQRNIQKKLKAIAEFEKEILNDIMNIQHSETREEFDEANLMFYVKWLSIGDEKVDNFIGSYHEDWVNSGESNWYPRAGPIDLIMV